MEGKDGMQAGSSRELVLGYISDNFDIESFTVERCPLFPGGVDLRCKGGHILVYADIMHENAVDVVAFIGDEIALRQEVRRMRGIDGAWGWMITGQRRS
jgi:hypothetical protein